MNVLDIIALVILFVCVLICAIKGLLKILAGVGSFGVALIASRLFGGVLGEKYLGEALGSFAHVFGTIVLFVVLLLVARIIFFLLAKLITKVLHTKGLDKFLGALVGAVGGVAGIYLFSLILEIIVIISGIWGGEAVIPELVEASKIVKIFM